MWVRESIFWLEDEETMLTKTTTTTIAIVTATATAQTELPRGVQIKEEKKR